MSKMLQRLNVLVISLLAVVLASVLVAQILPGTRPLARPGMTKWEAEWTWPKTLQVCPSEPGDPVKLVRILKDGKEIVPGTYRMPEVSGDHFADPNPLDDWLKDMSFVLENDASKNIVSVGIAVVFPARQTGYECSDITGDKSPHNTWCDAHPHWCDGGCPVLLQRALHWGRIPAATASGLQFRYRAVRRQVSPDSLDWMPFQGKDSLEFAPGQQIALSLAGRAEGWLTVTDPRHGFSDSLNGMVSHEGIEEAQGTEPCTARANSKTGCAFREVSKFNVGIVVVYFDDGTIWGNFAYGYAVPGPDGIFTRVGEGELPGGLKPIPQ